MTPRQAWEAFGKIPGYDGKDQSVEDSRTGSVGLDDLLAIVSHHTCRKIIASAEPWGLVDLPPGMVQRRLKDEYFQRRCQKVLIQAREAKPGCLLEARINIHKHMHLKHEAYQLLLHNILIDMGDNKAYYID